MYVIGLSVREIVLKEPLVIPECKKINLGIGCLVGGDGFDTIIVKSGGQLALWGDIVVTHAKGATGRGVYVERGGVVYFGYGEISGNSAAKGGGVYNEGTFSLDGTGNEDRERSVISGNRANFGGGVYNVGTFLVYGGEIVDNVAMKGGGIYNAGDFNNSYRVSFSSNVATSGEGDDVFEGDDVAADDAGGDVFPEDRGVGALYLLAIGVVTAGAIVVVLFLFYRSKKKKQLSVTVLVNSAMS